MPDQPRIPTMAELRERWREVSERMLRELRADPEGVKRRVAKKARRLRLVKGKPARRRARRG